MLSNKFWIHQQFPAEAVELAAIKKMMTALIMFVYEFTHAVVHWCKFVETQSLCSVTCLIFHIRVQRIHSNYSNIMRGKGTVPTTASVPHQRYFQGVNV